MEETETIEKMHSENSGDDQWEEKLPAEEEPELNRVKLRDKICRTLQTLIPHSSSKEGLANRSDRKNCTISGADSEKTGPKWTNPEPFTYSAKPENEPKDPGFFMGYNILNKYNFSYFRDNLKKLSVRSPAFNNYLETISEHEEMKQTEVEHEENAFETNESSNKESQNGGLHSVSSPPENTPPKKPASKITEKILRSKKLLNSNNTSNQLEYFFPESRKVSSITHPLVLETKPSVTETKIQADSGGFDVKITLKYPSVRGHSSARKVRKSRSVGPASSHGRKNAVRSVRKIQSADRATRRNFQKTNKVHVTSGSPEKIGGKIRFNAGNTRESRLNGSMNPADDFKGRKVSVKTSKSDEDSQEGSSSSSSIKAPARRLCSKWNQFKLPKYNGLNSEYGLSADQLYERKIQKAERAKLQRDLNQQLNAEKEEKQRINEQMFRAWLAKKREQSKQKYMNFSKFNYSFHYSKFSSLNRRSSSAQLEENRRIQIGDGKVSQTKSTEEVGSNFEIYLGLSVD